MDPATTMHPATRSDALPVFRSTLKPTIGRHRGRDVPVSAGRVESRPHPENGDPGSASLGAVEFGENPASARHHGQKTCLRRWISRGSTPIDSCGCLWTNRRVFDSSTPAHIWIDSPPTAHTQGYPQVIHMGRDRGRLFRDLQAVSVSLENAPQISSPCDALAPLRRCNRHGDACDRQRAGVSSDLLRGGDARLPPHALGTSDSSDSIQAWQGFEHYREILNMPKDLRKVATSTSP